MQEDSKSRSIAQALDGKVVDDSARVAVCIKGSLLGFPATMEAFRPHFPFGVNYYIETGTEYDRKKGELETAMAEWVEAQEALEV